MKPITGIENLKVEKIERNWYRVEWDREGHRYFVFVNGRHKVPIYRSRRTTLLYKIIAGDSRPSRGLNVLLSQHKAHVDAAIAAAEAAHLFEKCDAGEDEKSLIEIEMQVRLEQLRAAAPRMLKALQLALPALIKGPEYKGEAAEVIATVRAAIQQAAGRRPNKPEETETC